MFEEKGDDTARPDLGYGDWVMRCEVDPSTISAHWAATIAPTSVASPPPIAFHRPISHSTAPSCSLWCAPCHPADGGWLRATASAAHAIRAVLQHQPLMAPVARSGREGPQVTKTRSLTIRSWRCRNNVANQIVADSMLGGTPPRLFPSAFSWLRMARRRCRPPSGSIRAATLLRLRRQEPAALCS